MIKILDLSVKEDQNKYINFLSVIGQKRPYYNFYFLKNFSGVKGLVCIFIQDNNRIFCLPGHIQSINGFHDYFDFCSPYGYSGPILSDPSDFDFEKYAWQELEKLFKSQNIVSCFVRLSLGQQLNGFMGKIISTMYNIRGRIVSEEEQWIKFDYKVRKNVKRAQRAKLNFEVVRGSEIAEEQLLRFYFIYHETMKRNNAQNQYFYSIEVFKDFVKNAGDLCKFAFVSQDGIVVSTEMVLISNDSYFSFLGGTLAQYFENRPNDYLKFSLINIARAEGISYFVLGGGYGKEDGIYKYKKSFFPNDEVAYYTGRWILNFEAYKKILNECKFSSLVDFDPDFENANYFPEYKNLS
jgi:hypothetical protein